MKNILILSILSAYLLLAGTVFAVPNTFSSGQPARASDVNENFSDVEAQIQSNTTAIQSNTTAIEQNTAAIAGLPANTVYDYRDFNAGTNVTSKTFSTVGLCGDSEVRSRVSTVNGANTNVLVTRRRLNGAVTCQLRDFSYVNTPTERHLVASQNYAAADESLSSTITLAAPVIVATSAMRQGAIIASGTTVTTTFTDGITPPLTGMIIDSRTAVSLEDVSVPAGNYTACLKMTSLRHSNSFGAFQRISWHCPGLGEVKRLQMGIGVASTHRIWELTSVQLVP